MYADMMCQMVGEKGNVTQNFRQVPDHQDVPWDTLIMVLQVYKEESIDDTL